MAPPLAVPAAYLEFGFAGNGDVIVLATDDITDPKLGLWIARYAPDGTRLSKRAVDRRIGFYAGDWVDIDPTDDSVLISERDAGTTTYTGRRISSATGKTIASIDFHQEVRRVAIDEAGRMWAITPFYGTVNSRRPCIVDRLGAAGGIVIGVDHHLEECEVRGFTPGPGVIADPVAIEVGRDGRLVLLDATRPDKERGAAGTGLAVTVLSTAFGLVRQWHVTLPFGSSDARYGTWSQSMTLAAAPDGTVYVGETIMSDDGTRSTGFRVRAFDRNGDLLATHGVGGDLAGVTWPSFPNVDDDGRLWVIDLDTATRSYSIKVLE